jgi:hypothetical protein
MTRSIFDPGGGETERSGSTFRSEEAGNRSHVPPDVVDGDVSRQEEADAGAVADADAKHLSPEERIAAIPNTGSAGQTES